MINLVDKVIFLDDVQYDKGGWRNRNRVRNALGPVWLSVPVMSKGLSIQLLNEVKIVSNNNWKNKHIKTLQLNYPNADINLINGLQDTLQMRYESLVELNLQVMYFLFKTLSIDKKVFLSSDFEVSKDKNGRLIELCQKVGATGYLSGLSAKSYIKASEFKESEIDLMWYRFDHSIEYPQRGKPFISHLSILDLLLNNSVEYTKSYLLRQNVIEEMRQTYT